MVHVHFCIVGLLAGETSLNSQVGLQDKNTIVGEGNRFFGQYFAITIILAFWVSNVQIIISVVIEDCDGVQDHSIDPIVIHKQVHLHIELVVVEVL